MDRRKSLHPLGMQSSCCARIAEKVVRPRIRRTLMPCRRHQATRDLMLVRAQRLVRGLSKRLTPRWGKRLVMVNSTLLRLSSCKKRENPVRDENKTLRTCKTIQIASSRGTIFSRTQTTLFRKRSNSKVTKKGDKKIWTCTHGFAMTKR